MDQSGLFFKALPDTGLTKKSVNGDKKSKERHTVAFFVSSSGFKVCKHIVIGKSKVPRCFRKLSNPSGIQFSQQKSMDDT